MQSKPTLATTKLLLALASAALMTLPRAACAHGDEAHAAGPVRKEQKPWGIAGDASAVKRTITLTMSDAMRFTPERIAVKQGETVRIAAILPT